MTFQRAKGPIIFDKLAEFLAKNMDKKGALVALTVESHDDGGGSSDVFFTTYGGVADKELVLILRSLATVLTEKADGIEGVQR